MARPDRPVRPFGGEARIGGEHLREGLQLRLQLRDAPEQRVDRIDRREAARAERSGEVGRGGVNGIEIGHRLTAR
jgi:hypothetical protein